MFDKLAAAHGDSRRGRRSAARSPNTPVNPPVPSWRSRAAWVAWSKVLRPDIVVHCASCTFSASVNCAATKPAPGAAWRGYWALTPVPFDASAAAHPKTRHGLRDAPVPNQPTHQHHRAVLFVHAPPRHYRVQQLGSMTGRPMDRNRRTPNGSNKTTVGATLTAG